MSAAPMVPAAPIAPQNDGARLADDHFCQGCGARGVFGLCGECSR